MSMGHNSIDKKQLAGFIERVENLIDERININADIKDVMAEAKAAGYDPKALRFAIRQRAMDKDKREAERAMQDAYLDALGLL